MSFINTSSSVILGLVLAAFFASEVCAADSDRLMTAVERGDVEEFKKLVTEESRELEKLKYGRELRKFSGIEESDLMRSVALTQNWEMLGHLFSLAAPNDLREVGDFAVTMPNGARVISTLIEHYPKMKGGQNGARMLCQLVSQLDVSGSDTPHPYIKKLVEAGVPIESEPYSALVSAVEFRDVVLINYFLKNGADRTAMSNWRLHSSTANDALAKMEFNAVMLTGMSRAFTALKALGPLNAFAKTEIAKFEKLYPPQHDSPHLGTYEVINDDENPIGIYKHFRLFPDRTALFPDAGVFGAAVWTKSGNEITLHAIGADGPSDQFPTVLGLTDTPGKVRVTMFHGAPVTGVTAHLLVGASSAEFSVPKDSPAIGTWEGKFVTDGSPPVKIVLQLEADATGKMRIVAGEGEPIEMEARWKQGDTAKDIFVFNLVGGKVQRESAMDFTISDDGKKMVAGDDSGTEMSKVQ